MRLRRGLVVVALMLALPAAFMHRTVLEGRPLARDDAAVMVYPFFRALDRDLADGHLYLWDSVQWCGLPAMARGETGSLYPPTVLLAALLPWLTALHASYWLHLALGAAGMYWVARNVGASRGGAVVGAAAYAFSGYQAAHLVHFAHIVAVGHLPLMLALLQTALARRSGRWWALLALEVAIAYLGSHPMPFVMALTVCTLWLALGHDWRREGGTRRVLSLALAGVAALLLVMPQLLPMLDLAGAQGKVAAEGPAAVEHMTSYPFRARDLARVLLPNVFGTVHDNILGGGPAWHESQPFTGAAPLLLGIVGVIVGFRRRGWAFALAVFVVGAALMPAEGNPLHAALSRLPLWGGFRATGRWMVLPIFALALLSSLAITHLPRATERLRTAMGKLTALLAAIIVFAVVALWLTFGVSESGALVFPGQSGPVPVRVPADAVLNCVTSWEPLLLIAATIVTALVIARLASGRRASVPALAVLLLAVTAPQWHLWQVTNRTVPRDSYLDRPATVEAVRGGRITTLPPGVVDPTWRAPGEDWEQRTMCARELLTPALGTIWGVRYADGYTQGLGTPATRELWQNYYHYGAQAFTGVADVSAETVKLFGTPAERMKRLHWLAAVQHIVTVGEIDDPDLELTLDGPVRVYSYRERRSRWWLVRRAHVVVDPDAQLRAVKMREFDPDEEVIVDRQVALGDGDPGAETGVVYPVGGHSTHFTLCTICPAPRVLVLADAWHSDWRVTVHGEPAELLRANFAFRAVVVPAGAHNVTFSYRPASWPVALPLCALGMLLVIGLALWPTPSRGGGEEATT